MNNEKKEVSAVAGQNTSSKNLTADSVSQDALKNQVFLSNSLKNLPSSTPAKVTRLSIIRECTLEALENMSAEDLKNPAFVEGEVLFYVNSRFDAENSLREKTDRFKKLTELSPVQIAIILVYSYPIVKIAGADMSMDSDQDIIAMYQYDGVNKGLYVTSEVAIRELICKYNFEINARGYNEVMLALQGKLPRKTVSTKPNLVAVNNGIFDYDTKELLPFSPDYIFTAKSRVNYNPNAKNVVIHNDSDGTDWDVESWMSDLSDDPEIPKVLWQVLGAIIRPHVPWDKSAWFYSESGNNGKGTLCELMRLLCGTGSYASISLSEFSKDFMLEPLTRVTAIIVDENDVGTYIDKAANLKAVITNDVIQINRKFKTPVAYRYRGFMVQCLNEMPRIKDKSDSFFRRQLFIPFDKCFTGKERKYIKHDYLHRQEVLEYVLFRVLNMNYYELDTPQSCVDALDTLKEANDPVAMFMNELTDFYPNGSGFRAFDKIPCKMLFDMFSNWYERNNNAKCQLQSAAFNKQIACWAKGHSLEWEFCAQKVRFRKLKEVDMSIFRDFPAGNDWVTYDGNEMKYVPRAEGSKNYIVYVGKQESEDEEIQNLCEKVDDFANQDELFAEYLDAEKRYKKYDSEFKESGIVDPNTPKSYPYKMSFEMWLSFNNYDVTDERYNVSRWKNMIEDYDKKMQSRDVNNVVKKE